MGAIFSGLLGLAAAPESAGTAGSAAPGTAAGADTASGPGAGTVAAGKKVMVIPVEEQVDFGLHAYLKRVTEEALQEKPDYLVFKVNTYGGELHSAFEIVDLLLSIKDCSTYVYVEQKAISAGALISLACNRMAMGKGTTIGDCAPITQSSEGGIVMLGEKIQSPLRAKFRNLAERNGYPSLLSQAMVTMEIGVVAGYPRDTTQPVQYFTAKEWESLGETDKKAFRRHKILVDQGQLATFTDQEAAEYGFSQGSFESLEAFLAHKDWTAAKTFATTWSEDLVRAIGKVAPLLMLVGFGALYMEFKTPGFSIFGIVGILCLAVVFGSKYAVGLADHTEMILLLGGFLLFIVEVYVFPGTFIAGTLGLLFMVAALTLSLQGFTVPDPEMPWEIRDMVDNLALTLGMALLGLVFPLIMVRYVLPRLSGSVQVVSAATLEGAVSAAADAPPVSVGEVGVTRTPLRPAGKATFAGHTYEVLSRGEYIESGREVEVLQIRGQKVVVRPRGKTP